MTTQASGPAPYEPRSPGPALGAPPAEARYRWVYIWQWPIRAMHWVAALAIVALIVTGFYIGKPYFLLPTDEGQQSPYVMGYMRLIHFVAAGVLVATGIVRLYWLFAGNKYERVPALFPLRARDRRNFVRVLKYYLFLGGEASHPVHYLGHHPVQQLFFTLTYLVTAVMVVTGFTMYGESNPGGVIYSATRWVSALAGGTPVVRAIHHVTTWFFLIFIPIHVYLSTRADVTEKEGMLSSMISGGRFVRTDLHYEDE